MEERVARLQHVEPAASSCIERATRSFVPSAASSSVSAARSEFPLRKPSLNFGSCLECDSIDDLVKASVAVIDALLENVCGLAIFKVGPQSNKLLSVVPALWPYGPMYVISWLLLLLTNSWSPGSRLRRFR